MRRRDRKAQRGRKGRERKKREGGGVGPFLTRVNARDVKHKYLEVPTCSHGLEPR